MPTNRFATNALQGATPGLSRLAAALGGGQSAYEAGADQETSRQTKMAQALAQIDASKAAARMHSAAADQTDAENLILNRRQGLAEEQVAFGAGTDAPTVRAIREWKRTGQAPQVSMGPPAEDGSMGVGSQQFDPGLVSKVAQSLQSQIPLLTSLKDLNPEQLAKARELDANTAAETAASGNPKLVQQLAQVRYAAKGSAPYVQDAQGSVLSPLFGTVDQANPIAEANIGATKALAADRYASADAHRASANKTRADIEQGVKTGDIVVITDNDGNTSLLNKRTGVSRPATSADGVPLIGKSVVEKLKEVPAAANAKIIEGQQSVTNIDQAIAALKANPGAVGWSNMIPTAQTVKQLWSSPQDIATRAKVANIGSLVLHDRSGAAVSASEFPRLAPFIPSVGDSAESAASKLEEMKRIASDELGLYAETYGEGSGYRPNAVLRRRSTDVGAVPDDIAAILKKHGSK